MIPYELIMSSASRPHLLRAVFAAFVRHLDQLPERVIVHEDVCRPDADVRAAIAESLPPGVAFTYLEDSPPIRHGRSIHRLLGESRTEFVLYGQDDDAPVRRIPVGACLAVMEHHGLNAVRFNKRTTMAAHSGWPKREMTFFAADMTVTTLTLAEKLHFQIGAWRRSWVKAATDWWEETYPGSLAEHGEVKINNALSGVIPEFGATKVIDVPSPGCHDDHASRIAHCRTYIWGPIGEPPFHEHLGWRQEDWRDNRANRSGNELRARLAEEERKT